MIRFKNVAAVLPLLAVLAAGCSQNAERAGSTDTHTTPAAAKPAGMPQNPHSTGGTSTGGTSMGGSPMGGTPSGGAPSGGAPSSGDAASGIAWTAPSTWVKEQPASTMRAAQYRIPSGTQGVKDGELAVFFFGAGQGGQTQANLERWAGQFQQDDGSDPMKNAKTETFTTSKGLKVTTIALQGHYQSGGMGGPSYDEPGWRLFGAVVEGPGGPWFFKTVGPDAVIRQHHDEMITLLKDLRTTN